MRLRVLSYNIHKGFTVRNRSFVLHEIREGIRQLDPDVVFLQEVVGQHTGYRDRIATWPEQAQFEFVAHEIWPHYAYGKNAIYDHGHHGNALLSKFPILQWENEDVSTSALESRGILHAVVRPDDRLPPIHLLCLHFGLFERDRRLQARKLCERICAKVRPADGLIVAGDFNDWTQRLSPYLSREAQLKEAYRETHRAHARTFPARLPVLRLDRIYYRGLESRSARCLHRGRWGSLSDHAALLADFDVR